MNQFGLCLSLVKLQFTTVSCFGSDFQDSQCSLGILNSAVISNGRGIDTCNDNGVSSLCSCILHAVAKA